MIFSYFTSIASPGVVCRKSDWERMTSSKVTAKLVADYRNGNPNAKKNLPAVCFHASFPHGKRKSAEALPSGAVMVDFDKMTAEQLKMVAEIAIPRAEEEATSPILLVHITPSGKGLRVVAKATKSGIFATCSSLSDYQHALAKLLRAEQFLDEVCTDLARLSFVPQASDVLYLSDRLFNEAPEVTDFTVSVAHHVSALVAPSTELFPDSTQKYYEGVPLKDIFECYIDLTGGMPHEGGRNSRYYAAARDLRYICDFNPKVIAPHLPDCGLSAAEVFQLCASACQSSRAAQIPEMVTKSVAMARSISEDFDIPEDADAPSLASERTEEERLHLFAPALIRDFAHCCPPDFREATLLALLPILGTLSTRLRATYLDGEVHSPSFFTVVTSEQASGKSFARRLVKQLLASIAEEDAREREIEQKYHEALKVKKNAKEQPEQPRVKIRLVPASISIAKLLQRLDYAEGDHLFSFAEEMDTLIKSNKSGTWSEKNDLYRNAFDNSDYGQDFMSENSYSANKPVYYNLLVLGTPRQTARFFTDVENGLVSRCCFSYLPDQFGAKMPTFKKMEQDTLLKIEHYVKKLRESHGMVDLSFLSPALNEWLEKQRLQALAENNRARDIFRRRSAVIAFRAVLALSPLYQLSQSKTRKNFCLFATELADLVLKNQLVFAGDKLNAILSPEEGSKPVSLSIYEALPQEFNVSDLAAEMRKRQMKTPAKQLVYKWVKNSMIEKIAAKTYKKLR